MTNSALIFGSLIFIFEIIWWWVHRVKPDHEDIFQMEKLNNRAPTLKTVILFPHKLPGVKQGHYWLLTPGSDCKCRLQLQTVKVKMAFVWKLESPPPPPSPPQLPASVQIFSSKFSFAIKLLIANWNKHCGLRNEIKLFASSCSNYFFQLRVFH